MDRRVGQHSSVIQEILKQWTRKHADEPIVVSAPKYKDIVQNGLGSFYNDPSKSDKDRIYYE